MTLIILFSLIGWIFLAFFNGKFWLPLLDAPAPEPDTWPSVDIIVPARNEAESLPHSLPSLLTQDYPGAWRLILVDDHSEDGTAIIAKQLSFDAKRTDKLTVIEAPDLPAGWSGKVATMQAGVAHSKSDFILFTDADIRHPKDSLRRLVARASIDNLDLTSLMVKLHCTTPVENLLIPAFVFFFAMLYPFRRANNPASGTAAAAGGVMLVRKKALKNIGGLARIKSALIDDCALARAIKYSGGDNATSARIRLTLTQDVHSLRVYPKLSDVTRMIARTAFTQLSHSWFMLGGTLLGLALLFIAPLLAPFFGTIKAALTGYAIWLLMSAIYWPMTRFYGLTAVWALTLPAAAVIYMVATFESAWRYARGQGGQWKGRSQAQ